MTPSSPPNHPPIFIIPQAVFRHALLLEDILRQRKLVTAAHQPVRDDLLEARSLALVAKLVAIAEKMPAVEKAAALEALGAHDADCPRDVERDALTVSAVELGGRVHEAADDVGERVVGDVAAVSSRRVQAARRILRRAWGL
jgi:hypothetical protein